MKKNKNSGMSALKLALIITGSIVVAAGIIFAVVSLIKKHRERKALAACDCCDCCEDDWSFDDDMLGELRFDDEDEDEHEHCCACGCADCESEVPDDISAAVDEAIEAIESISDEEE